MPVVIAMNASSAIIVVIVSVVSTGPSEGRRIRRSPRPCATPYGPGRGPPSRGRSWTAPSVSCAGGVRTPSTRVSGCASTAR
eukprot:11187263-Lingulodinium_polyedra.AAC.1